MAKLSCEIGHGPWQADETSCVYVYIYIYGRAGVCLHRSRCCSVMVLGLDGDGLGSWRQIVRHGAQTAGKLQVGAQGAVWSSAVRFSALQCFLVPT